MTPNERKTLHLEGTVENVLYCNPDNGYTVLELDADGTLVTVVGEMGETEEGERLSVDGEYTTHPRFGMQFRAQYWERKLPADAFNIQRYLSSGAIKGIGPSLAKKSWKTSGTERWRSWKGAHPSSGDSGHLPEKVRSNRRRSPADLFPADTDAVSVAV